MSLTERISRKLSFLLGILISVNALIYLFLSFPLYYIYRQFVILLGKVVRPDLDTILDPQSSLFSRDYFDKNNPRANYVISFVLKGHLTINEVTRLVLEKWIHAKDANGNPVYKQFQQYPVQWMGHVFWKHASASFAVENHIVSLFDHKTLVTGEQFDSKIEELLNTKTKKGQSPWMLYLVENYQHPEHPMEAHSVLMLKAHHSLADGFAIKRALLDLCEVNSEKSAKIPVARYPKRSLREQITYLASFPVKLVSEYAHLIAYNFLPSPWAVADKDKSWYQVHAKSPSFSIQDVKNIKNTFRVSFTSVMVSAVGGAVRTMLAEMDQDKDTVDSMSCLSVLPVPGKRQENLLTNMATCAVFALPTGSNQTPAERLRTVHVNLESTKMSMIPVALQGYSSLCGIHLNSIGREVARNRFVPLGITNFPGPNAETSICGKTYVDGSVVCGGMDGIVGVTVSILSYHEKLCVSVAAEKSLMSQEQAKYFVKQISVELQQLKELAALKEAGPNIEAATSTSTASSSLRSRREGAI